jgi:hypothetical protein
MTERVDKPNGTVQWSARLVAWEAVVRLDGGLNAVVGPFDGKLAAETWLANLPKRGACDCQSESLEPCATGNCACK